MMQLIVWNSQGAKWDTFWSNYILPLGPGVSNDIVGLLVEAGWAPWVQSGDVTINEVYKLDRTATWYFKLGAAVSSFCQGIEAKRVRTAYWVPWVKNLDGMHTNSRCSMGAAVIPGPSNVSEGMRYNLTQEGVFIRPVFRLDVRKGAGTYSTPVISVFLVHLISGYASGAQAEIDVRSEEHTSEL